MADEINEWETINNDSETANDEWETIDEWETVSSRGVVAETAAATARGWLELAEGFVGAAAKFHPVYGKYGIFGAVKGLQISK